MFLGASFVGQLIQRKNIHIDHGIFGSPDFDRECKLFAWFQSKLLISLLANFIKNDRKRRKFKKKLKEFLGTDDEQAELFIGFSPYNSHVLRR